MTQSIDTDVLNRLATAVESLNQNVQELKLESRVFQAQVTEKLAAIDQRFEQVDKRFEQVDKRLDQVDQRLERMEKRIESQDNRVWTILLATFTAILGVALKLAFFPDWPRPAA